MNEAEKLKPMNDNECKSMSSDAIGEYYCLCELLLAEKEAYLANGLNQKGWDIAVLDKEKTLRVQVKCINWNSNGQAAVKGHFYEQEFDFMVIVLLNFNQTKFTSFVVPYNKLKEKGENNRNTLIDDQGFVYYSARKIKPGSEVFERKQAIAISTLNKKEVLERFKPYLSKYDLIKS